MESSYMMPPNKTTSGLGITSLVLGSIALVICWIPLLGCASLPLGILGLIFGIVGLIVASSGKMHGMGIPVAGSVVSVVSLLGFGAVAIFWGAAFHTAAKQMQQQAAMRQSTSSPTTQTGDATQP
jgi:membrane-bound ClpP family serine protease